MLQHCIILVRPETSANIGAVCRAMATCDLNDLRIVGNKSDYDEERIARLALYASDIWQHARFFEPSVEGLRMALADTEIAFASTRRSGKKRTKNFTEIADCARNVFEKNYTKAAFVFGNERTGLSDAEIAVCNEAVYIPTSKNFGSLNLSHAVQIVAYEVFKNALAVKKAEAEKQISKEKNLANLNDIQTISEKIIDELLSLNFFRAGGREENYRFFSGILSRAALSDFEARHLADLLNKIRQKRLHK